MFLLCQVGQRVLAIPISGVVETMRPLPIEPFAEMPSFVRGVALVRGAPVPVVDARALLGVAGDVAPTRRFVTLKSGRRIVALAVEDVIGVRSLSSESMTELPPLLGEAITEAVSAIGALDAELLVILQAARILPDSAWATFEAERDAG